MTNQVLEKLPATLRWEAGELFILDQTRLPLEVIEEKQNDIQQVWESIRQLKVRGAPAIGIAGAYGLLVGLKAEADLPKDAFLTKVKEYASYLDTSRPTAVNLSWALKRLEQTAQKNAHLEVHEILQVLEKEAISIHDEDRAICHAIGKHGEQLIEEGSGVLTHCNAGSLAVSELGTALAPIYKAFEKGRSFRVYADETRPLLQGARLTTWELTQVGVDTTLICDNMSAHIMSQGLIDAVFVGTDRVAANGDVANKIGTMGVAILARHFGIPFYVCCPSSTIDLDTPTGRDIVIEERGPEEVTSFGERITAPKEVKVRNPAFDVTPAELVTAIITEKGILYPPYPDHLKAVLNS